MINNRFTGVLPAIFSVYDKERNVIKSTVKEMVDFQLAGGSTGFYVGGNTGECTVLPEKTRRQMLEAVKEYNADRGDIIVHIGAGHIDEVYSLIDHANEIGVDAIASLPPSLTSYYNMEEIIEYYRIIAKRSKAPVLAYVTGVLKGDIRKFASTLATIDNVMGIKISVPDYHMIGNLVKDNPRLNILNGPDQNMISGLAVGADGAIGTSYNFMPKVANAIYTSAQAGDFKAAMEAQRKLNAVIDTCLGKNLGYWKAVMTTMGFDMGYNIEPAKLWNDDEIADLKSKLTALGFYDWL